MRKATPAIAALTLAVTACGSVQLEQSDAALEGVRVACVFGDPLYESPVYGDWEEIIRITNETGVILNPESYDDAMHALDKSRFEYGPLRQQALDKDLDLAADQILEYADIAVALADTIPQMWQFAEGESPTSFWVLYSRFTGLCLAADQLRHAVTRAGG